MLERGDRLPKGVPSTGYLTAADGVRLYYRVEGHGPEVVVVLHGGPGLSSSYLADDFGPLEPGRTLIYYDQRGGGFSGLPDASLLTADRMVADLEAVRRHFGLERLTVVGHSWGAALAALYATRFPDRVSRLVLLGPAPGAAANAPRDFGNVLARFTPDELALLTRYNEGIATGPDPVGDCERAYALLFSHYQRDPASLGNMRGRWCGGTPEGVRYGTVVTQAAVSQSLGPAFDIPAGLAQALGGRRVPTLVVEGAASPFVQTAAEYAAAIPGATFVRLGDVGHFGWLEDRRAYFRAADLFLRATKRDDNRQ